MYSAIGGIRIPCTCSAIVERAMNIILLNLNTCEKKSCKKFSSLYVRQKILNKEIVNYTVVIYIIALVAYHVYACNHDYW